MPDENNFETNKISELLNEFIVNIKDNTLIVNNAIRLENEGISALFSKKMRDYIIDCSFLKMCTLWEQYLERLFISFMLKNRSESTCGFSCYVSPIDDKHAYNLICNVNNYPDWSDCDKVLIWTNLFFDGNCPLLKLSGFKGDVKQLQKIRNHIAHNSEKSKATFLELQRNLGVLPASNTTAELLSLTKPPKKNQIKYYDYYAELLEDVAKLFAEI